MIVSGRSMPILYPEHAGLEQAVRLAQWTISTAALLRENPGVRIVVILRDAISHFFQQLVVGPRLVTNRFDQLLKRSVRGRSEFGDELHSEDGSRRQNSLSALRGAIMQLMLPCLEDLYIWILQSLDR